MTARRRGDGEVAFKMQAACGWESEMGPELQRPATPRRISIAPGLASAPVASRISCAESVQTR